GASHDRIAAFADLVHPMPPRLVITARRARALGLDATRPVLLDLAADDDAASIIALAAADRMERTVTAAAASPAAGAALELAKLAQRLPALLVGHPVANAVFDPPLVTVAAVAVAKFRDDLIRSLAIAGEAQVPLHSGLITRFVVFRDAIGGAPVAII